MRVGRSVLAHGLWRGAVVASCAAFLVARGVGCGFPDVSFDGPPEGATRSSDGAAVASGGGTGTGPGSASGGNASGGPGAHGNAAGDDASGDDGPSGPSGADGAGGGTGSATTSGGSASGGASSGGASSGGSGGGTSASSGGGSGSSGSSASSGSGSGSGGSSSGATGPCTCSPGQTLAYPTNITCGSVQLLGLGLVCSGPTAGFKDNGPPCGRSATLTTCAAPVLNLNVACTEGTGATATQQCQ